MSSERSYIVGSPIGALRAGSSVTAAQLTEAVAKRALLRMRIFNATACVGIILVLFGFLLIFHFWNSEFPTPGYFLKMGWSLGGFAVLLISNANIRRSQFDLAVIKKALTDPALEDTVCAYIAQHGEVEKPT